MASSSPPKPWETTTQAPATTATSTASGPTDHLSAPAIPPRPAGLVGPGTSLTAGVTPTAYGYGSGTAGYSPYNRFSPYSSRFGLGSSYGTYGGGYGGYGSYGGYGTRYGGGGYYGGNRPSLYNGEEPTEPWTTGLEASTRSTFQVLEQIVNAFGGFAQMLDSTFQATHSSFMAMMGMAEQLGVLRSYLGQILGVFALARTLRNVAYRAVGQRPPVQGRELNADDFVKYQQRTRFSAKPLVVFVLVVIGFPYLMMKLIRKMAERQLQQQQQRGLLPPDHPAAQGNTGDSNQLASTGGDNGDLSANKVDPLQLDFAQALYDFQGQSPVELTFKRGTIIAVLNKNDAQGQPSLWWQGRLRTGETGYFPANYVELVKKQATPPASSSVPPSAKPTSHNSPAVQPKLNSTSPLSKPSGMNPEAGLDNIFDPNPEKLLPPVIP
ncbi:Peroxisomal membrane protein PAS20 [Dispira parvispora]|uniref:Peroxisomal membrane protein PEX13 n=1 Tax=Dispira parvispora TaxID=1520584 RepID=A0A9W8AS83_9FUNG|nr:Peroxisomal membrane protein PAS20 [Dispira parvispora]